MDADVIGWAQAQNGGGEYHP